MGIRAGLFPLFLSVVLGRSVSVLYSSATPFNVSTAVDIAGMKGWEIEVCLIEKGDEITGVEGDVVLDYLYEEGLSRRTREKANYYRMWEEVHTARYARDFSAYITALHLSNIYLIGDTAHIAVIDQLYSSFPFLYSDFSILPIYVDLDFALQFVGRFIKPRGLHFLALFLTPQSTCFFLQALQTKKLNRTGHLYLLSQDAGRYRFFANSAAGLLGNGVVVVGEESEAELTIERAEAGRMRTALEEISTNGSLFPRFALLYTQQGKLITAALTPADISNSTLILFPGNSIDIPKPTLPTIRTSVNYEAYNPDGSLFPLSAPVARGVKVAFEEANNRTDLLTYYRLIDESVGFTGLLFSFNFSLPRVQAALPSLGLVYFAPPVSQAIIGMTQVFQTLNISIPILSASLGSALSDSQEYPLFMRTRPSNKYTFTTIAWTIKYFGWKNVAFLYTADEGDGEDAYRQFLAVKGEFGINITNPEALRALPPLLNAQTSAQVNASLQAIIESTTRVIVIVHDYQYVLMDQLYDLGVREEYVQIYVSGLSQAIFQGAEHYKRRIVSKGALLFYPRLFIGPVGSKVKQELMKRDGQAMYPSTCLYYDAAYLYFYATDYLLQSGYDYEDPFEIVRAMRGTYFHGCSGLVKIEKGMNDRIASEITITNFQYDSKTDNFSLKLVGSFNPFSIQPYQITSPIQWPDDRPSYADLKPYYQACPFLAETVRELPYGGVAGMSTAVFLYAYTLASAIGIRVRNKNLAYPRLTVKQPISVEDFLVLSAVLVDFCQLAALFPHLKSLSYTINQTLLEISLYVTQFATVTPEIYWIVLSAVIVMVYFWVLISLLLLAGCRWILCCDVLELWADVFMPTFFFMPIISTLTSVFQCSKGVSEKLTDSFFDKDCTEFCWRGTHLGYAIASGLALVLYIPLAQQARVRYQEVQANLHVKAWPGAVLAKSTFQVYLIVAGTVLDRTSYAYLLLCATPLYLVYLLSARQYNYSRLNLWQVLLTLGLLSLFLCAHISSFLNASVSQYLLLAILGEYVMIAGVGVILQACIPRFASKLMRERSKDVRGLFRFAFTGGRRASLELEQYYASNPSSPTAVNAITSEQAIVLEIRDS